MTPSSRVLIAGATDAAMYSPARGRGLPTAVSALALTGPVVIASNAPMTALRITGPRSWSATDRVTDLVPHLGYGAVAPVALRALR